MTVPTSVAAEEARRKPVALAGVGDAVWPLSSKEEADLRERWRQHVGHNAIRPDDTIARLLATLDAERAARSRPAGELDVLREALTTIVKWQTHGPLQRRDAEAMVAIARAALASSTTTEAGAGPDEHDAVRAFAAVIDGRVASMLNEAHPDYLPLRDVITPLLRFGAAVRPVEREATE